MSIPSQILAATVAAAESVDAGRVYAGRTAPKDTARLEKGFVTVNLGRQGYAVAAGTSLSRMDRIVQERTQEVITDFYGPIGSLEKVAEFEDTRIDPFNVAMATSPGLSAISEDFYCVESEPENIQSDGDYWRVRVRWRITFLTMSGRPGTINLNQ